MERFGLLNCWVTCTRCSRQLSLISSWVSIKTAEPAAQTATLQSELWRMFDRTGGASRALPKGCHIQEVQLWCVVTSPHKPETHLLILLSDQRQETSTQSNLCPCLYLSSHWSDLSRPYLATVGFFNLECFVLFLLGRLPLLRLMA